MESGSLAHLYAHLQRAGFAELHHSPEVAGRTLGAIHVFQVPESAWPRPLPPPIGCNLSTNRKRKPKWRRCVAASIAVGPSAILTGSRTRPSDRGSNHGSAPWKTEETIVGLPRLLVPSVLLTFKIFEACADFLTPDGHGSCRKRRNFGAHCSLVQSCGCVAARRRWVFSRSDSPDLVAVTFHLSRFSRFSRFGGCHLWDLLA